MPTTLHSKPSIDILEVFLHDAKLMYRTDGLLFYNCVCDIKEFQETFSWLEEYLERVFDGKLPKTAVPLWLLTVRVSAGSDEHTQVEYAAETNSDVFKPVEQKDLAHRMVDEVIRFKEERRGVG